MLRLSQILKTETVLSTVNFKKPCNNDMQISAQNKLYCALSRTTTGVQKRIMQNTTKLLIQYKD